MVAALIESLPRIDLGLTDAFRLVNTRYPTIPLFDDVAEGEEFDALYALQALTNPRIQNEMGNLNLVPREELPLGIRGCSYAVAPFTHVNPNGSRFSDGDYGVLYLADTMDTAIKEVKHHQQIYWQAVEGLKYDRMVFQGLKCSFNAPGLCDAASLPANHPIFDLDSYSASRILGTELKAGGYPGIQYRSVRKPGSLCWGLFTPKVVTDIIPTMRFEFVWNNCTIAEVNALKYID